MSTFFEAIAFLVDACRNDWITTIPYSSTCDLCPGALLKAGDAVRIYGHGSLATRNAMMRGVGWLPFASIYPKDWDWSLSISIYYQSFVGCASCVCAFLLPSWPPSHWQTTFKAYGFLLCFAYIGPLCITFMTGGMETNTWEIYGQVRFLVLLFPNLHLKLQGKIRTPWAYGSSFTKMQNNATYTEHVEARWSITSCQQVNSKMRMLVLVLSLMNLAFLDWWRLIARAQDTCDDRSSCWEAWFFIC